MLLLLIVELDVIDEFEVLLVVTFPFPDDEFEVIFAVPLVEFVAV